MHRIDHATAAPGNLFTEGNPATATPATTVTDDWLNDMQENLAQLVEAASIALVKGDGTQVTDAIQALIAAAIAGYTTPPQFDNDTSLATTEFVNRAGKLYADSISIGVTTQLTAEHAGKLVVCPNSGITLTLPLVADVRNGTTITVFNTSSAASITVQRTGANVIGVGNVTAPTAITIAQGEFVEFVATTGGYWMTANRTAQMGSMASFAASLAVNGWARHPSGLIIQWGYVNKPSAGAIAVTWPIAFPNGFGRCVASFGGSSSPAAGVSTGSPTLTGATFYSSVGGAGYDISYIVIGW